jgi:hypothetical protein
MSITVDTAELEINDAPSGSAQPLEAAPRQSATLNAFPDGAIMD